MDYKKKYLKYKYKYINAKILTKNNHKLLPIFEPKFNLKEASKELILLEDHLFNTEKRCDDCIRKHFLKTEGFLEEAYSLDKTNMYQEFIQNCLNTIRSCEKKYLTNVDKNDIGQDLRIIRKELIGKSFDIIKYV